MKNKILVTLGIVVLIIIGLWYFLNHQSHYKNVNASEFKFETVSIRQSPLYEPALECIKAKDNAVYFETILNGESDLVLKDNVGNILIPSIRSLAKSGIDDCMGPDVSVFSQPIDGPFVYIKTNYLFENGKFNAGLDKVYKLDLVNHSMRELKVSEVLKSQKYFGSLASTTYSILPDGKNVIKSDYDTVRIVNLEQDIDRLLFQAPKGEWLVSKITAGMDYLEASYNVEIANRDIIVSLFDMNKTSDNKPIFRDRHGNIEVDFAQGITPLFLRKITIPIAGTSI